MRRSPRTILRSSRRGRQIVLLSEPGILVLLPLQPFKQSRIAKCIHTAHLIESLGGALPRAKQLKSLRFESDDFPESPGFSVSSGLFGNMLLSMRNEYR
jgi:hypothetical protein